MNTKKLRAFLHGLLAHLGAGSTQHEREIQRLHQSLSRSLLLEDLQQLKGSRFAFEDAELVSPERMPSELSDAVAAIAEGSALAGAEPEFRVFVREVPVRSTQLEFSAPLWAGGAEVDHTIGPLTNIDGRLFWFDFFRIEVLKALYIAGNPNPVLLFKAPLLSPSTSYKLSAGSVWIYSQILAANAPAGFYTGLTIKSGTVTLSAPPTLVGGKLTLSPNVVVTVRLQLRQPAITDADPSSPYGIDAREAELQLPAKFSFHFSGQGRAIDEVADAQWQVYGDEASFHWNQKSLPAYDDVLHRVLIPLHVSRPSFEVQQCHSPFNTLNGRAHINGSAWALPAAPIDVLHPTPAAGIGALVIKCGNGLTSTWQGLQGGDLNLNQPYLMAEPGRISITDLMAGNLFCQQTFKLWKDEQNSFGTSVQLQYSASTPFFYNTFANGEEALMILANADVQIDRPVTVAGEALAIRSKNSVLILAASKFVRLIYLYDDNILFDNTNFNQIEVYKAPVIPQPIALALRNALFKVTPVNGCFLFGQLAEDFVKVSKADMLLTFGMYAYLPTLPDPYAANLNTLRFQFRGTRRDLAAGASLGGQNIWLWLVCRVKWSPEGKDNDAVDVSFHFAPLQNQFQLIPESATSAAISADDRAVSATRSPSVCETLLTPLQRANDDHREVAAISNDTSMNQPLAEASVFGTLAVQQPPDYQGVWDNVTRCLQQDCFALLDVSTNADLLGVSFNVFDGECLAMFRTSTPATTAFPIQVQGMDVVSRGNNVSAFTVPEISWEPVLNTAPRAVSGDPPGHPKNGPDYIVPNYYKDDGGPTRIHNNSVRMVPIAPIPLSRFIIDEYQSEQLNITSSLFTLPFGLRALAVLNKFVYPQHPPSIEFNRPAFENDVNGGLQLQFNAGKLPTDDFPMFNGGTLQINNILDFNGSETFTGTLGQSVGFIFNDEFHPKPSPNILISRGVPLTRVDFCGYGASIFSNWFNPLAQMAQTSQSKFDVWVGRTAHEVIQVKSIIYPWGIRVVRTIILYRASTGFVYRVDTGWKAESDGKFDFSYYIKSGDHLRAKFPQYKIHPGVVKGLFNVKNIVEEDNQFPTKTIVHNGEFYLDDNNFPIEQSGSDLAMDALLQMVYFDADIEIEDVVQGHVNGRVPSKKIMGFVQLAPRGIPLSKEAFKALLDYQPIPIGAPVDSVVNIGKSGQQMRLNRLDVNNSFDANGIDPVFVAAARGNVVLPKDGSWSMVMHQHGTGEVTPLPEQLSVPLIRIGELVYNIQNVDAHTEKAVITLSNTPANPLLRIANPTEILRQPMNETINYGYLHSTDTQKALFLTPSYKKDLKKLLSKTPPLFVDAFRIVNSKAIFPNIDNAVSSFGEAISLVQNGTEFFQNLATDGGKKVLELMDINKQVGDVVQEGYKLLKNPIVKAFDLPSTEWELIKVSGFRIYIEYKADNVQKEGGGTDNLKGSLDFDVDSFANDVADRWKSRMANVAVVVDLGKIDRLMTIKGSWDAKKGSEAQYKGGPDFPSPQIEFSKELQPVIDILQILQDLQGENYKDAFQKGLKLAMSNKAGSWEYKFEAAKEIPVVRFPVPDAAYNDPNAPFKLEAGLKLGAYFNAALKVTTDPTQLLPTAGGYLGFYGRLSVMCVSLSVATVYAVGQVNLDIGVDTQVGPSLRMKFGFGAQLVVGLPVVGNVSVLYMVGVEIYADKETLTVSAFLLFQGHAELLAGLVSVTITIEAKGTISRAGDRTDLAAQVTFGLDISIFLVIDISFSKSWQEQRQIA